MLRILFTLSILPAIHYFLFCVKSVVLQTFYICSFLFPGKIFVIILFFQTLSVCLLNLSPWFHHVCNRTYTTFIERFVTNIDIFVTKLKCVIYFEQTPCCCILNQIAISMTMHKGINTLYISDDTLFVNYSMITHVCINKSWPMNSIPVFYFHIWLTITHLILKTQTHVYYTIIS